MHGLTVLCDVLMDGKAHGVRKSSRSLSGGGVWPAKQKLKILVEALKLDGLCTKSRPPGGVLVQTKFLHKKSRRIRVGCVSDAPRWQERFGQNLQGHPSRGSYLSAILGQ